MTTTHRLPEATHTLSNLYRSWRFPRALGVFLCNVE